MVPIAVTPVLQICRLRVSRHDGYSESGTLISQIRVVVLLAQRLLYQLDL